MAGKRPLGFAASRGSGASDLTFALWTEGTEPADHGLVLVSVTDFLIPGARNRVAAWAQGPSMRRLCASMPGAIGFWLWVKPFRRRSGSVSAWRSEDDLRRFVGWPSHVEIMRRYRGAGEVTSTTWWAEGFDAAQIWATAEPRLSGHDPELGHPRARQ
jgi:heme-degrading monooxygenase HmoA